MNTISIRLNDDVLKIKGVGEKKKDKLQKLGINTVEDLLGYQPVRYKDRRNVRLADEIEAGRDGLVSGRLLSKRLRRIGGSKTVLECMMSDESCGFAVVFFNMPFMAKTLVVGETYSIFGKVTVFRDLRKFTNPEIAVSGSDSDERGYIPVYRCTSGLTSRDISKMVRNTLESIEEIDEWIDPEVVEARRICNPMYAYRNYHFPEDSHHYKVARYRFIYEQLLIYRIAICLKKLELESGNSDASLSDYASLKYDNLLDGISFRPTDDQMLAMEDIRRDLALEKPMNRLLQGDVGSGKTLVAEAAIVMAFGAGYQSAFMVPTEILASQHMTSLERDFANLGIRIALLTSSTPAADKRRILEDLRSGDIDCIVGTHALIQSNVEFDKLGLVITDEQHRFGVNQRKLISNKGDRTNILVMSATPIPRTLATTVYGDMDFSIIREKPANRLPVITRVVTESSRKRAYAALKDELTKGNKAYIVAPSIEAEDGDMQAATELFDRVKRSFKEYKVGLLHGRLDKNEKERVMQDFAFGDTDILVCTVVIEVGIDVPDATMILIENSERFGLAQLHQLRGRVGRSDLQSYCYLVNYGTSDIAKERAKLMATIDDGFVLSEEDYRLRGPGDITGTMQHGASGMTMSLFRYTDILDAASEDAERICTNADQDEIDKLERIVSKLYISDNSDVI